MIWLIYFTIFINAIIIPIFIINTIVIMRRIGTPKMQANIGAFSAAVMCLYLITIVLTSIISAVLYTKYSLVLLIYALALFVIGYFVQYKSLKFYVVLQVLSYSLSLITLLLLFK